ncbi:hypothetical protein VNI00_015568 [Paramarasmius palmivorus]|uniref:Uncharacterized protein n=1 Tax=Paramarasmius palmivorus TaxID=297713 RepID=A0AAW0BIR1_9AGAR
MALDYLSVPGKWFSILLSAQTTQSLMCLGCWSLMGMVHDEDLEKIAEKGSGEVVPEDEQELVDIEMPDDFADIVLDSDDDNDSEMSM